MHMTVQALHVSVHCEALYGSVVNITTPQVHACACVLYVLAHDV